MNTIIKNILISLVCILVSGIIVYATLYTLNKKSPEIIEKTTINYLISQETEIVVFGTDWCPTCKNLKEVFKKNEINYVWKNIDLSELNLNEFKTLGRRNGLIPLIVIDGKIIEGFDESVLNVIKEGLK